MCDGIKMWEADARGQKYVRRTTQANNQNKSVQKYIDQKMILANKTLPEAHRTQSVESVT